MVGAVQHIGKLVNKRIVAPDNDEALPELILIRQQPHPDTVSPRTKPSTSCGISIMPSAFMNEDTTPLPRLSGDAVSLSPT